jgi:hypothetical protein
MEMNEFTSPEEIWDAILSREAGRIRSAWQLLDREERAHLMTHLERMVSEDGWHPEQVISARCALEAIRALSAGDRNDPQ